MARNRISPIRYFIEFIIIISGIMGSFLLNEWREGRKIDEQKDHLITDINKDLYTDSVLLDQAVSFYKMALRSHDSLLIHRNEELILDSLHVYLDHFISYYPFNETATTYQKILNNQNISINREDTIIEFYMSLHKQAYPNMHEWMYIEKDFIITQALPYMDANAPFMYPPPVGKSFDGRIYYELRKKDVFLNMVKSGRLYKESMLKVTSSMLAYVKFIKGKVVDELERVQKLSEEEA